MSEPALIGHPILDDQGTLGTGEGASGPVRVQEGVLEEVTL